MHILFALAAIPFALIGLAIIWEIFKIVLPFILFGVGIAAIIAAFYGLKAVLLFPAVREAVHTFVIIFGFVGGICGVAVLVVGTYIQIRNGIRALRQRSLTK